MSFFDEAEEEPTLSRATASSRRRSRDQRRPAPVRRQILVRRAVLFVGVIVAAVLIVVGVHSCQVAARNSAMRDYDNSVASLVQRSNQTGHTLFSELSGASGSSNQTGLQTQLNQTRAQTVQQLRTAENLSVPDAMKTAQNRLLLALRMRADAVTKIAQEIQPALATPAAGDAVATISRQMSRLYASDVLYNDYVTPALAAALHSVGIAVGGFQGQPITHGNFVPSSQWLSPTFVAQQLGSVGVRRTGKPAPGIHGHRMESVTVNGVPLETTTSNSVPASPPPTFVCTFQNDGQNTETDVVVKVAVSGTSISGHAVVPKTVPGQSYTVHVTLPASPPAGSYTVSATVERVPGETVLTHNTLSFPVTFH